MYTLQCITYLYKYKISGEWLSFTKCKMGEWSSFTESHGATTKISIFKCMIKCNQDPYELYTMG